MLLSAFRRSINLYVVMQQTLKTLFALCAIALVCSVASTAFASADMYLEIKDSKGKTTKVKVDKDGRFTTGPLAKGKYTFSWSVTQRPTGSEASVSRVAAGKSEVRDETQGEVCDRVCVHYSIQSPRDAASGQASGKRMDAVVSSLDAKIDKEVAKLTARFDPIVLDMDCDGISGSIDFKTKDGKKSDSPYRPYTATPHR